MEFTTGIYTGRAIAGQLGETKSGKEQVSVEFELTSPGFEGQHLTWRGWFTEKTTERTIRALRTCGWQGDDLTDLAGIEANEVSLVVEMEEYDGKVYPRIQWINALDSGSKLGAPLAADKAKAFAAKMRGTILALDGPKRAPAPAPKPAPVRRAAPSPAREPGADVDADIPF